MSKTKTKGIRTNLDIAEDIGRVVYSGAHFALGGVIAAENVVQNAAAEALENFGYIGLNGYKVIARAAFAAKRGVQDTCSFIYRGLANKSQLVGLKDLDEHKENIDLRLDEIIRSGAIKPQLNDFEHIISADTKRRKITVKDSKMIVTEEEWQTIGRVWNNRRNSIFHYDDQINVKLQKIIVNKMVAYLESNDVKVDFTNVKYENNKFNFLRKNYSKELAQFKVDLPIGQEDYGGVDPNYDKDVIIYHVSSSSGAKLSYGKYVDQHKWMAIENPQEIDIAKFKPQEAGKALERLEKDSQLDEERENVRAALITHLESKLSKIGDENLRKEVGDVCRDHEAYTVSLKEETARVKTNNRLAVRNEIKIHKTSYGLSLAQEAAKSVGGALKRLVSGEGKADKSKTLYETTREREKGHQDLRRQEEAARKQGSTHVATPEKVDSYDTAERGEPSYTATAGGGVDSAKKEADKLPLLTKAIQSPMGTVKSAVTAPFKYAAKKMRGK